MDNNIIVKSAREWIGTKFVHKGRVKKNKSNNGGCDCIGLIIGVANELNIKYNGKTLENYDESYNKVHDYNQLKNGLNKVFKKSCSIENGTIILFQMNRRLQHVAISVKNNNNYYNIIHADAKAGRVVETGLDNKMKLKIIEYYKF